jgi:hypothetical protein
VTDRHQGEHDGVRSTGAENTRWSVRQITAVTAGVILSLALWTLTPLAHGADGGWLSNLTWTLAATTSLGIAAYTWRVVDGHRSERRGLHIEEVVHHLYDRQEQLASEIQAKQNETAEQLLARQEEVAARMAANWAELQRSLDGLRKRVGKLVALQEQREAAARVRSEDFHADAKALADRMDALALLIETRLAPRQLGLKNRSDGS